MFRPYMWAIFRLRFNLQISYTRCVGRFVWGLGGWLGEGTRSRCFDSGYHDPGLLQVDFHWLFMYIVHMYIVVFDCTVFIHPPITNAI